MGPLVEAVTVFAFDACYNPQPLENSHVLIPILCSYCCRDDYVKTGKRLVY